MYSKFVIKIAVFSLLLIFPLFANAKKAENNRNGKNSKVSKLSYPAYTNELFVMETLRKLYDVQANYAKNYGNGFYGNLQELKAANLIDDALASGVKYGYRFNISYTLPAVDLYSDFVVAATPVAYRKTGKRSFRIDIRRQVIGIDRNGGEPKWNDPVISGDTPYIMFEEERRVIDIMRTTLPRAQKIYRTTYGSYGSFSQLLSAGLIPTSLGRSVYSNHSFYLTTMPAGGEDPPEFKIHTEPTIYPNVPGIRRFFIDQTGILRATYDMSRIPNENDPPVVD